MLISFNRKGTHFYHNFLKEVKSLAALGKAFSIFLLPTQNQSTETYNGIYCNPEAKANIQEKVNIGFVYFFPQ